MKTLTLGERGRSLPVGRQLPDGRDRSCEFKPWSIEEELAIGELIDQNRAMRTPRLVSEILARFLSSFGGMDFTKLKDADKLLTLSMAWAGDVFHAWFALRREVLGDICPVPVTCQACKTEFTYEVDLASVDEDFIPDDEPIQTPHTLRDGFLFEGEKRNLLTLTQLRWFTLEAIENLNPVVLKLKMIAGSVAGVAGAKHAGPIPEGALRLTKWDMETLSSKVNEIQAGPHLDIDPTCPHCKTVNRKTFSWGYDPFFTATVSSPGVPVVRSSKRSSGSPTAPDCGTISPG